MTQGVQLILFLLRATPAGVSSQDLTDFILSVKKGACVWIYGTLIESDHRVDVLPTHGQEGVVLHHYI